MLQDMLLAMEEILVNKGTSHYKRTDWVRLILQIISVMRCVVSVEGVLENKEISYFTRAY